MVPNRGMHFYADRALLRTLMVYRPVLSSICNLPSYGYSLLPPNNVLQTFQIIGLKLSLRRSGDSIEPYNQLLLPYNYIHGMD